MNIIYVYEGSLILNIKRILLYSLMTINTLNRVLTHKMIYWRVTKGITFKDISSFSKCGHVV